MDLVLVGMTTISLVLAVIMGVVLFRTLREERRRSDARVALLASAAESASPVEGMFLPETTFTRSRRVAAAAGVALLVMAGGYALLPGEHRRSAEQPGTAASVPLELLALRHAQDGDVLRISGVVQNPPAGRPLSGVVVTATVFDAQGRLLTVERSKLTHLLGPGSESPFVINVPVSAATRRYRVSFRGPEGEIIAHVDRRANGEAARHTGVSGSEPWVP